MENRQESYIRIHQEKIAVTVEIRKAWNQPKDRVFHQAHNNGVCANDDFRKCGGDCALCPWAQSNGNISLDDEEIDFHDKGKGVSSFCMEKLMSPDPADIVGENDFVDRMRAFAKTICDQGDIILAMHVDGYSSYEIASATCIPQKTVYRRITKLKAALAQEIRRHYADTKNFPEENF